jgi:hypothetical protein
MKNWSKNLNWWNKGIVLNLEPVKLAKSINHRLFYLIQKKDNTK